MVFRPGIGATQSFRAIAAIDGRIIWSDPSGELVAIDSTAGTGSWRLYGHGALLVGSSGWLAGCLGWTRGVGRPTAATSPPRVVIVGAGFGGLEAANALAKRAGRLITLIDRQNHHLLPAAALSGGHRRALARGHRLADPRHRARQAQHRSADGGGDGASIQPRASSAPTSVVVPYDYLVLATGATHSYFGHDEWAPFAPGLKTIEDATEIRRRLLLAFERAEMADERGRAPQPADLRDRRRRPDRGRAGRRDRRTGASRAAGANSAGSTRARRASSSSRPGRACCRLSRPTSAPTPQRSLEAWGWRSCRTPASSDCDADGVALDGRAHRGAARLSGRPASSPRLPPPGSAPSMIAPGASRWHAT